MAKPVGAAATVVLALTTILIMATQTNTLVPYTRPSSLFDRMMFPYRILEQTLLVVLRGADQTLAARADWKETAAAHVITLDIPGMKREDVKIEVEDCRVLRVSGERKEEEEEEKEEEAKGRVEVGGERWHRAERVRGKFWRQFRIPMNADLDHAAAHMGNGVLRITVPKYAEEKERQPKLINIAEDEPSSSSSSSSSLKDMKPTKAQI